MQYEFLGPIKLDEWGPPMEKVVYLILAREKDTFKILYADECEKTNENGFFIKNPNFKCWVEKSGSEKFLYLAILPMFESDSEQRKRTLSKIIARYQPICNTESMPEKKPDYVVRSKSNSESKNAEKPESEGMTCPCCGAEMKIEKVLEKSCLFKCSECGLSNTKLNS